MDETPPLLPKKPTPANANKGASLSARKIKPDYGVSKESRFVGYMVLGFGIVAVMSVLLIAANRFGGGGEGRAVGQPVASVVSPTPQTPVLAVVPNTPDLQNRVAKDLLGNLSSPFSQERGQYKEPPKDELYFKRQPDLDPAAIEGAWQAMISNSTAVLQLSKGTYQIVMADPAQYSYRQYSSGTYTVMEDLITLTPRNDWAPPSPPKGTDVVYAPITSAPFPVMAGFKSGKMLWQNPPSSETRIYVPRMLPLLQDSAQGYIVWQPVKK